MYIGAPVKRVDGYDKAAGRARFTDDLCPKKALVAKVLHATIAHGYVRSFDLEEAKKVPGVVGIYTCFDVPKWGFGTDGHPWHMEHPDDINGPHDNMDRRLLEEDIVHDRHDIERHESGICKTAGYNDRHTFTEL